MRIWPIRSEQKLPSGWKAVPDVERSPGIILGIARFYHDPRGAMRGVLASRPSESKLLVFAMLAATILLVGRITQELMLGTQGTALSEKISAEVVSLMFFLPLFYYALAALGTMLAKLFRGQGNWWEGRAAFFWAALVSAPILMLSSLAAVSFGSLGPVASMVAGQLGAIFFAWALAQCYAEAFAFRRSWAVLAVIAAIVGAISAIIYLATH